ncbi:MAG: Alanine dehydrogenase/(1)-pyrroline-2-carboxylate reductase ProC [Candidatus Methanohalarchaeum thermophilum]|uniref:Alanine dehydrogenase n=1 Tax=Methanohalarchaeum thermophilum TaxID=1903181 RepID=A0A1Q6DW68_METT1|nr:MAG: Alanine dehydrogenase/(1)-pyrroline-2-carboxylate reductase ProC [Candidatus Methanohalarchaeum thermophilum]
MVKNNNTVFLDGNRVSDLLSMEEVIEAVESAFKEYGEGKTQIPAKTYLFFDQYNGDYRSMLGYLEEEDVAGCKLVNVHPDNEDLPTVLATLLLIDPKTGYPFCLMDATELTSYRTGAAGAVATKYLSKKDSSTLGLIGSGVQAKKQFQAINEVRDISYVKIYDIDEEKRKELRDYIQNQGIEAIELEDAEEVTRGTDILVTTTPVREPIIKESWIEDGLHINAIGADAKGKQELEGEILKKSKIYVDQFEPAKHGGEINVPYSENLITEKDINGDIGELVTGKTKGRKEPNDVTIFDSTGLAVQDVATGWMIYNKANKPDNKNKEIQIFK